MDKIIDILDSIAYEKGIKIKDVESSLKESLIITAKKMVDFSLVFDAEIDKENKQLKLFQKVEVVKSDDERLHSEDKNINKNNFIDINLAKDIDKGLDIGDFVEYDLEFENMGRNAATILNNNFEYKINLLVEANLLGKYQSKIGKIITGNVTRVDKEENTYIDIAEVKGMLSKKHRIKGESFKIGDSLKAILKNVNIDKKHGLIIELSRTSPKFLEELLILEVPELKDEKIFIEASARIPGSRAKIAISSTNPQVDPIGSIVGVKGIRISAVSQELNGENIDCIEYSTLKEVFVARSLSPAIISNVKIEKASTNKEKDKATISMSVDQKAKAIGKAGLNIRLASMLTKCDIVLDETLLSNNHSENENKTNTLESLFK
jgi:transcription termination/antitermination protein NusA